MLLVLLVVALLEELDLELLFKTIDEDEEDVEEDEGGESVLVFVELAPLVINLFDSGIPF